MSADKRQDESSSPYRSLAELLENPGILDPPDPVVPRLAWRGRITLLAAREKDGKSTIAGAAAAAVTRGASFLDGEALFGTVVLASLEEHIGEIATRLVGFNADPDLIQVATYAPFNPLIDLQAAVEQYRPVLVIVDTLSAFAEGRLDDGSASAWQPLMSALTRIARDFDCAVLIIHHSRKSDGHYRDSTAIGANVDCIIEMFRDEHDSNLRLLKARSRFSVPECTIRYTDNAYELVKTAEPEVALRDAVTRYVNEHPGCSLNELRKGVHVGSYETRGAMANELLAKGVLREERGARNARRFSPAVPAESPAPPVPAGLRRRT